MSDSVHTHAWFGLACDRPAQLQRRSRLSTLACAMHSEGYMTGLITEMHFEQAETVFPGIRAVYLACEEKPPTFLDLLARYLHAAPPGSASTPAGPVARRVHETARSSGAEPLALLQPMARDTPRSCTRKR